MDLSILIVNWNTREFTRNCLQSLAVTADRLEADLLACGAYQVEVIVVDNGSQDQSAAMIRAEFSWARLIENADNRGFAPANNQAYQISRGRYVLLLNSDTEVLPDSVRALMDFMESHPGCGGGGALLRNADGSLQPSCHPMLTPWREFWRLNKKDQLDHHTTLLLNILPEQEYEMRSFIGNLVVHPNWGIGKLVRINENGNIEVQFEDRIVRLKSDFIKLKLA